MESGHLKEPVMNKAEEKRKKANDDILKRMKNGDPLTSFSSHFSWFPPRPIVKKDKKAIAILYPEDKE